MATKLYWLVENRESPRPGQYLVREHYGSLDWSDDPHSAMKFSDKALAEQFIKLTILRVYSVEVCEHMFGCESETETSVQATTKEDGNG